MLLMLLMCGAGVFLLVRSFATPPSHTAETQDEHQRRIVAGFGADNQPEQSPEYEEVKHLVRRLQQASAQEKSRDIVDSSLLYREMAATGEMDPVPSLLRTIFMSTIMQSVMVTTEFDDFVISSITAIPETDNEFIAMVHTTGADFDVRYELYLIHAGNEWKIYDWSEVGTGMRYSRELAIINGSDDAALFRNYENFYDTINSITEDDDEETMRQKLKSINVDGVHPEFRNRFWALLANYWSQFGDRDEAIACLENLSDPESPPDAILFRGMLAQEDGEYQEAVEHFDRYEQLTGDCLNAKGMRRDCLEELGDEDGARAQSLAILKIFPDHSAIESLGMATTSDGLDELVAIVRRRTDPMSTVATLMGRFYVWESPVGLRRFSSLAQELQPKSTVARLGDGMVHLLDREFDEALTDLLLAWEQGGDPEQEEQIWDAIAETYLERDGAVGFYEWADDKYAAFEHLYYSYQEYSDIDAKTMLEVARRHQITEPQSELAAELFRESEPDELHAEMDIAAGGGIDPESTTINEEVLPWIRANREDELLAGDDVALSMILAVGAGLLDEKDDNRIAAFVDRFSDRIETGQVRDALGDDWESSYATVVRLRSRTLVSEGKFHEAIALLSSALTEFEQWWSGWSVGTERWSILTEMSDVSSPWLVHGGDQYSIEPVSPGDDLDPIMWDDFQQQVAGSSDPDKLLARFPAWEKDLRMSAVLADRKLMQGDAKGAAELLTDKAIDAIAAYERRKAESEGIDPTEIETWNSTLGQAYETIVKASRLSGDMQRASKYADRLAEDFDSIDQQIHLAVVRDEVDTVEKMMSAEGTMTYQFSSDPQLARHWFSPKFDSLRQRFPETWSADPFDRRVLFVVNDLPDDFAETLKQQLIDALDEAQEIVVEPTDDPATEKLFGIQSGSTLLHVSTNKGTAPIGFQGMARREYLKRLEKADGWVAFEMFDAPAQKRDDEPDDKELLASIVQLPAMIDLDIDVVVENYWGLFDSADIQEWRTAKDKTTLEVYDFDSSSPLKWLISEPTHLSRGEALYRAAKSFRTGDSNSMQIQVQWAGLTGVHRPWLKVIKVVDEPYATIGFHAAIDESSLNPSGQMLFGDAKYFFVDPSQVIDWK